MRISIDKKLIDDTPHHEILQKSATVVEKDFNLQVYLLKMFQGSEYVISHLLSYFDFKLRLQTEYPDSYREDITQLPAAKAVADIYHAAITVRAKRYKGKGQMHFIERGKLLYWYLWYTFLALQADGMIPEFQFFETLIGAAHCVADLEDFAICIKVFAGHNADDREQFLTRLRKVFSQRQQQLKAAPGCGNCDCEKGIKA